MKAAIRNGAKLIVADPRAIELTRWADVHLQCRTGADVPMYNALLHVIIRDGLVNEEFVADRVKNFQAVAAAVRDWTPERQEALTGIPPATLERAAHIIGKADKTAFYWGLGISEHTHGTEACLTLINLALATGNVGRRGTGLNPLRGQNNVQGTSDVGAIPMYFTDYRSVEDEAFRGYFEEQWGAKLPAARASPPSKSARPPAPATSAACSSWAKTPLWPTPTSTPPAATSATSTSWSSRTSS